MEPDFDPVGGVGSAVCVDDVDVLTLEGGTGFFPELVKFFGGDVLVGGPPDMVFGFGVADGEFVFGGATGVFSGLGDEGSASGEVTFLVGDG